MPKIDPVPLPYGSPQYHQLLYIVQVQGKDNDKFLARCKPLTRGYLSSNRVVEVKWIAKGKFAEVLQGDIGLTQMLKEVMQKADEITVDPQETRSGFTAGGIMRKILCSILLCWKLQTG
jgi:hypothetical protein